MRPLKSLTIILTVVSMLLFSCEKDTTETVGKNVELYLIESYETTTHRCHIDENTVITKSNPIVYYSDIISYDPNQYIFELSEESQNRIKELKYSLQEIPFAVKVNNEIVYTGYFWSAISSDACDWITICPDFIDLYKGVKVELLTLGQEIPDNRNATEMISILRSDNKLIE